MITVTVVRFALAATLATMVAIADPAPTIHYAPAENLERLDVALIDRATKTIDMAAYVLTDFPVIEALTRAAQRGVVVRIYIDRAQREDREPSPPMRALEATPGVTLRVKKSRVYMHLKSYAVDGAILRSGAANLSASGLKRQDNDLIILESPDAAARFEANFQAIWSAWEREGGQAEEKDR